MILSLHFWQNHDPSSVGLLRLHLIQSSLGFITIYHIINNININAKDKWKYLFLINYKSSRIGLIIPTIVDDLVFTRYTKQRYFIRWLVTTTFNTSFSRFHKNVDEINTILINTKGNLKYYFFSLEYNAL